MFPVVQVLNKQVVTRTTGRSLGCISGAWLDPARGTLVSFDLDDRKPGSGPGLGLNSPARAGNIPLSALRQVRQWVAGAMCSGLLSLDQWAGEEEQSISEQQIFASQTCFTNSSVLTDSARAAVAV